MVGSGEVARSGGHDALTSGEWVLEAEVVLLKAGDSFVIPGSMHGWRNPFADHALMVCSVTALIDS